MSKSKKSKKKNKKDVEKEPKGDQKLETTLHGYPMVGPFKPSKDVWYCDHKQCQYTQHGLYRRYKIEKWRSSKFGKKFVLCDGCVRQFAKPKPQSKQSSSSSSSSSNVNVKLNINGINPGYQPGMAPAPMQQPCAQPQVYAQAPQAYGQGYMNGYPSQMHQQQAMNPQMQVYGQQNAPHSAYGQQMNPQMQVYGQQNAYGQQMMQQAYDGQIQNEAPQVMHQPPPPTEPPPMITDTKTEDDDNIVVNGVVKQGWMMKKGDFVKSWKKRYFVLRSNRTLNYYESDNAVMVKGTCPLDKVKSVKKKSAQSFEIATSKRTWCFACKDTDTRDVWVKRIKSVASV